MQPRFVEASHTKRWKEILAGITAAFLLIPVPALAALDFTTLTWQTPTTTGQTGLISTTIDTSGTTEVTGVLKIFFASGSVNVTADSTWSITGTFTTNDPRTLSGNWTGSLASGSFDRAAGTIGTTVDVFPTNDEENVSIMFSESNTDWLDPGLTPISISGNTAYTIKITFSFSNGTAFNATSTPQTLSLTSDPPA